MSPWRQRRFVFALGTLALAIVVGQAFRLNSGRPFIGATTTAWSDRRGMAIIASRLAEDAIAYAAREFRTPKEDVVIYVFGEPGLFFQLRMLGVEAVPIAHAGMRGTSGQAGGRVVFLASGPHAMRSREYRDAFQRRGEGLALIAEYEYPPSNLVWLDNYSPAAVGFRRPQQEPVELYLVREFQ